MILVFNASPVIVLAKAGLLNVFAGMGKPAIIPQAVLDEVLNVEDSMDPRAIVVRKFPVTDGGGPYRSDVGISRGMGSWCRRERGDFRSDGASEGRGGPG